MELKCVSDMNSYKNKIAFNRTAYGIEITMMIIFRSCVESFNRTAYGIEIFKIKREYTL